MNTYFEIKALPNLEIAQSQVVAYLLQHLHQCLPPYQGRIGISFPMYSTKRTLGGIIRVMGSHSDIEALREELNQISDLQNYGFITPLADIPKGTRYGIYERYHPKQTNSRLLRQQRRHQERGTWTPALEEVYQNKELELSTLPHAHLQSSSTRQPFNLFIKRTMVMAPKVGRFNAYGLSLPKEEATVPWF